tara:strand:- start:348 stop:560 length:213 start_codon:yes stop_codon:yes gene_type:complete
MTIKVTNPGHTIEGLTDLDINVIQVALTHLIEELSATQNDKDFNLDAQLVSAKKIYLSLGGGAKRFWENK